MMTGLRGKNARIAIAAVVMLAVTGCSSWMGENQAPPLPGKRISVLANDRALEPDLALAEIKLPKPLDNDDWPQVGGYSHHAMHHMVTNPDLRRAWSSGIGSGSSSGARLLTQPVVAEGKIFTLDTSSRLSAYDMKNGDRLWRYRISPNSEEDDYTGGGIAYENGRIYVATPYAQVMAFDAKSGRGIWRENVSAPVRGAPTVRGGRVFVITIDNQTHALAADDGRPLWTHSGLSEAASLLGGASPAVDGDVVVVPYSSGELYALRIENGGVLWQDSLAGIRRTDQASSLTDIRGLPVIDRGRVFAISNSDLMVAVDLRTGKRLWDRPIGGIQTPWVAGDYLFVITNSYELAAMEAKTGNIKWVLPLQRWEDEEDREGRVLWTGPVLASDRLVVTSSHGWAVAVSPYTGQPLGRVEMPDGVTIAPVVAQKSLLFLTEDADLVVYR